MLIKSHSRKYFLNALCPNSSHYPDVSTFVRTVTGRVWCIPRKCHSQMSLITLCSDPGIYQFIFSRYFMKQLIFIMHHSHWSFYNETRLEIILILMPYFKIASIFLMWLNRKFAFLISSSSISNIDTSYHLNKQ